MKFVLYQGWLGHQNLGDEALFAANQRLFYKLRFLRCDNPIMNWFSSRACLLGGGTYINEARSVPTFSSIQAKRPLVVFGAGVQNPLFWKTRDGYVNGEQAWNSILNHCRYVGVRGPHSMQTLSNQGYNGATLTGDPVLSLAARNPSPRKSRRIGINFGDTGGVLWGGSDKIVYDFFRELIRLLLKDRFIVELISVCPQDTPTLRKMQREFQGKVAVQTHYKFADSTIVALGTFDVLIGQKLHSVALSHCAYTPALMIEYRPKCADYMASMGLERYNFRCDRLRLDQLYPAVVELSEHDADHQAVIYEQVSRYKRVQSQFAEEITQFIEGL